MSKRHFLDFEQPIAVLDAKIEELRYVQGDSAVDISEEIDRLDKKSQQLTKEIYTGLTPWQVTQIARHPQRPYTLDYVTDIFSDFQELHGDRHYADDQSIVGGLARFTCPVRFVASFRSRLGCSCELFLARSSAPAGSNRTCEPPSRNEPECYYGRALCRNQKKRAAQVKKLQGARCSY